MCISCCVAGRAGGVWRCVQREVHHRTGPDQDGILHRQGGCSLTLPHSRHQVPTGHSVSVADPGCLSGVPDPTFFHPGSEFFPSRIRIKEFRYFKPKKWFLSSRKYDAGCSFRIPNPDPGFLSVPDPGVKKAPDHGFWIRVHNTAFSTSTKRPAQQTVSWPVDPENL